jgi:nitrile hydratase accessory protein
MSGVTPAATRLVMNAVRGIPRDRDGPVFREPWEAQAFAMAVTLQARGLFTWSEWAAALGEEIKRAQAAGDPDTGETYYRHWLATLERMVAQKGVTDPADAGPLSRCLGSRCRTHAARHADRTAGGGFRRLVGSASVPIPKFATRCSTLDANFGIERTLANL